MPQSIQERAPAGIAGIDSSEARQILITIRTLRQSIADAWQSRSVILTEDERQALRDEIRDTCDLLTGLTSGE